MSAAIFQRAAPASKGSLVAGAGGGPEAWARCLPHVAEQQHARISTLDCPMLAHGSAHGVCQSLPGRTSSLASQVFVTEQASLLQDHICTAVPDRLPILARVDSSCLCWTLGRCNVAQNAEPAMLHASGRMSGSSRASQKRCYPGMLAGPLQVSVPFICSCIGPRLGAVAWCPCWLKVYQGSNVGRAPCLQRFSSELHQLQKAHLWQAQVAAPKPGQGVSHTLPNSSMLESALLIAPCWPMAVHMASARACQGGHHHLLLGSLLPSQRVCCGTASARLLHPLVPLQLSTSSYLATVWAMGHTVQSRFKASGIRENVRLVLNFSGKKEAILSLLANLLQTLETFTSFTSAPPTHFKECLPSRLKKSIGISCSNGC